MRKLAVLLLALVACLAPVQADEPAVGGGGGLPPALYFNIADTASHTIKTGAGVVYGFLALGLQTHALTCWDNTTNSGTPVLVASATEAQGTGVWVPGGISFTTGLTCQVPTAIVTGVNIYYR